MSIRAYAQTGLDINKTEITMVFSAVGSFCIDDVFNLDIMQECIQSLNNDCCGIMDVDIDTLKELQKFATSQGETAKRISSDIKMAKKNGESFVTYYCM